MEDKEIADVPSEGAQLDIDKSFDRLAKKTEGDKPSSESQPEKKETVKSPSQGGESSTPTVEKPLPFHQHPRWIKQQEESKALQAEIAELKKFREEAEKGKVSEVLPAWWKSRYGEDAKSQQSYRDYAQATQAERERIKEEVKQDILKEQSARTEQSKAGEAYVEDQIAEMTEEGLKFERNELLKFMVDFQKEYGAGSLLDAEGKNYDFRKSLALMQKMNPKQPDNSTDIKKRIAADTGRTKVKTTSTSGIPVISRKALRGSWRDAGI